MKKDRRKIQWNATTDSGGRASIGVSYLNGKFTKEEKESTLAGVIAVIVRKMCENGFIRLMSPKDLSVEYGKSRQYWEKLLKTGKIPYQKTASGKITTNLWVEGYLNEREAEKYGNKVIEMRKRILENEQKGNNYKVVECICGKDFNYNYNGGNNINGICRNCGFHLDTQQ